MFAHNNIRLMIVAMIALFYLEMICEAKSLHLARNKRSQGNKNVNKVLLNYQLESLGSGATDARLVGSHGNTDSVSKVISQLHGDGETKSVLPGGGAASLTDAQIDAGKSSLSTIQIDSPNNSYETSITFGFPIKTKAYLTEFQKRLIYRKTVELCRMIRHKLSRNMNLQIECDFPGKHF